MTIVDGYLSLFFFFFLFEEYYSIICLLFNNTTSFTNFDKCIDAPVDLLLTVGCRQLDADARLALGHHGVREADDVDAAVEHVLGHLRRQPGVAQHDRHDGVRLPAQHEARLAHAAAEVRHVAHQGVPQRRVPAQAVEDGQRGARHAGGQRVGEQVRPRALAEEVDERLGARGVAAGGAAEGLAEGGVDDVDALHDAAVLGRAAAGGSHEAGGVALVDEDEGAVLVGEVADLGEGGDVAVHGEDAVGGDHLEARAGVGCLDELGLEVVHVHVGVAEALRLREAHAVDDAGVVELVRDDGVFGAQQALEYAGVGVEAAGVQDRVFGLVEFGDLLLKGFVDVLRAANEPNRR